MLRADSPWRHPAHLPSWRRCQFPALPYLSTIPPTDIAIRIPSSETSPPGLMHCFFVAGPFLHESALLRFTVVVLFLRHRRASKKQDRPGRSVVGFAILTFPSSRFRKGRVADAEPVGSASATRSSQLVDATRPRGPPSGWRSPRACRAAPTQGPPRPHRPGSDHPCRACRRRTPPRAGRFRPTSRAT